jgi:hypothetical protein
MGCGLGAGLGAHLVLSHRKEKLSKDEQAELSTSGT